MNKTIKSIMMIFAAMFMICAISGCGIISDDVENKDEATSNVYDEPLDFELKDVNGKTYKLSDYRGKKVYIKFWASWCGICIKTLPETDAMTKNSEDIVVLSVVSPGINGEKSIMMIFAAMFMICAISGCGIISDDVENKDEATSNVYDEPLDFELKDVNGKTYKLSDYRGKKVYIKFWASWCGICIKTLPETDAMTKNSEDIVVLSVVSPGINGEKTKEEFIQWYNKNSFENLPVLLDENGELSKKMSIQAYPTSVFIDSEGKVKEIIPGAINEEMIRKLMKKLS